MHAIAAFLCGLMAVLSYASAQEMPHIHGVTVPDWYDADCCNNKDCHLLEAPDRIEIVGDVGYTEHDEDEGTDRPVKVFLYRYTRAADGARAYYRKDQLRASQDERWTCPGFVESCGLGIRVSGLRAFCSSLLVAFFCSAPGGAHSSVL